MKTIHIVYFIVNLSQPVNSFGTRIIYININGLVAVKAEWVVNLEQE